MLFVSVVLMLCVWGAEAGRSSGGDGGRGGSERGEPVELSCYLDFEVPPDSLCCDLVFVTARAPAEADSGRNFEIQRLDCNSPCYSPPPKERDTCLAVRNFKMITEFASVSDGFSINVKCGGANCKNLKNYVQKKCEFDQASASVICK